MLSKNHSKNIQLLRNKLKKMLKKFNHFLEILLNLIKIQELRINKKKRKKNYENKRILGYFINVIRKFYYF